MKSFTVGVIASLAALAAAQDGSDGPACIIPCFTKTVTDYPPLECKESSMFGCFCKDPFGPDLQRHFVECLRRDCADEAEVQEAMQYGKDACKALGGSVTITDFDPPKTSAAEQPSSSAAAAETTSEAPAPESTSKAEQPSSQQSEAPSTPAGSSAAVSTGGAKPTTGSDVVVPTKSAGAPASSAPAASTTPVIVNAGNSNAVSGLLAAAGVALAVFRL